MSECNVQRRLDCARGRQGGGILRLGHYLSVTRTQPTHRPLLQTFSWQPSAASHAATSPEHQRPISAPHTRSRRLQERRAMLAGSWERLCRLTQAQATTHSTEGTCSRSHIPRMSACWVHLFNIIRVTGWLGRSLRLNIMRVARWLGRGLLRCELFLTSLFPTPVAARPHGWAGRLGRRPGGLR